LQIFAAAQILRIMLKMVDTTVLQKYFACFKGKYELG
jgi:hypothetical protein